MRIHHSLVGLALVSIIAACAAPASSPSGPAEAPATLASRPLADPGACRDRFVAHPLMARTEIAGPPYEVLDGNGSGLALGDLNGDGRIDLVLGNLNGPNAIFWNLGELRFQRQSFGEGQTRAVSAVDVEGDGDLDIVTAHRYQKPALWLNTGQSDPQRRFVQTILPDVNNPAYSLNWSDLDGDGDLDLVAGSYDTELLKHEGLIFEQRGNGVGVFVYRRDGNTYISERLADQADALAIALPDLNSDGRRDILVGNDFNRRDVAFVQQGEGWQAAAPFARMTENTMSLDAGDIDNDGRPEIFAADMKPFHKDTATMAEWLPMMKRMTRPLSADDPQYTENALQTQAANGSWSDIAYARMIDSSGWSWSSKFGDLDNDGFLDLYIVNGMLAGGLFDHLPGQELVEPNLLFHNDGEGGFSVAPESWGLARQEGGRGMSMADLDEDGDLDIVVNNLNTPSMVLENRLCGGRGLEVDLRWSGTQNLSAIGATVTLSTSLGPITRDVKAASGYLSGDVARVHFGLPAGATVEQLVVHWPDGAVSRIPAPELHTLVTVTR
jgi:hypothetical protein